MVCSVVLALLAARGPVQVSQGDRSAGAYAASLNWDASKSGPLLYLTARGLQTEDSPNLAKGFTLYACGNLHVVAPAQMTVIDPDYDQAPNIYDGLPRRLKVLYLASTFTPQQWKTACTTGVGLSDLSRDQQAVYRSILPSVFEYDTSPVFNPRDKGSVLNMPRPTQTTLTTDEESQVKLKIFKQMTLGVHLEGGGFSAISAQPWDRHKPGELVSHRIDHATEDKNWVFGVEVRKARANAPKLSDLDYKSAALDAPMPLKPSTTVQDLCAEASGVANITILADDRFRRESVTTLGTEARCGDVLKALALAVTGTYRRVGHTFVLTSDLEGIGSKMAKLAFWQWNLKQMADKDVEKWKAQMSASPGVRSIAYEPGDKFVPNDAMKAFMETDGGQGEGSMPASQLSDMASRMLHSPDVHFGTALRTDVAEPWDSVFWCFVAPGERTLGWESELCDLNDLTHHVDRNSGPGKEPERPSLGGFPDSALVYQTQDEATAADLPKLAKGKGFTEVWLQTTNPAALSAAINAGKASSIPVKLVVEPFTAVGEVPKNQLDRSILDQTYSQAEALTEGSEWTKSTNQWISANERPVDFVDESSPLLGEQWQALSKLASTPGLAGTVALSVTPVGYEKQSAWPEYTVCQLGAPLMMGYTPELREKFLLANSVDPVDLLEVRYQFDLQPLEQSISSFGDLNDYVYGKVEQPGGFRDKWDAFRWEANGQRLKAFEKLFATPLLVEWRRKLHDTSMQWDGVVSAPSGDAPSETLPDHPIGLDLPPGAYYVTAVGYPITDGAAWFKRRRLKERLQKQATPLAVDLRAVPPDQVVRIIDLIFAP